MAQLFVNALIAGGSYGLIAVGFSVIYATVRFFHFSHGAVYACGAYIAYFFSITIGVGPWGAFGCACLATMLLGVGLEAGVYRHMRKRNATDLTFLIASLGVYIILQNILSMVWGDSPKSPRLSHVVIGHEIFGARITNIQILIITVSALLIVLTFLVLSKTSFGRAIRALANDHELACITGISADRYFLYAFAVGSFMAAVAGIMVSFNTDMTPTMGFNALIKGVIAVIIGGMGSMPGAALGGLFLGLAENLGVYWLPTKWQDSIAFVILILFLLFRPYGILGKRPQKAII